MAPSWISLADRFVVNIALPALIVAKLSQVEISGDTVVPVAVAWMVMAVSLSLIHI